MAQSFGRDPVIVGAVGTPVGKGKVSGALHGVHSSDLLAHSLRTLVDRAGIDPVLIDDVITGAAPRSCAFLYPPRYKNAHRRRSRLPEQSA